MAQYNLATNNDDFVFIDKLTGTVLMSSVVAVPDSFFTKDQWEAISNNDSLAFDAAEKYGIPLYVKEVDKS